MPSFPIAANFILFQAAWFAGILAPFMWASALVCIILLIHLIYIARTGEWRLLLLVMCIGFLWDSLMSTIGIFIFNPQTTFWTPAIIPLWLLLLWGNFATTLCHSLHWLGKYKIAAAIGGAIFGPMAYLGGAAITDKLTIASNSAPLFVALSAPFWAALCAFLPQYARRFVEKK